MEETLGKRIMRHRKTLGLTQDQLAEQLGVTAQAVSKWENDQSCPDITMLPRLSGIFGITTDQLLGSAPEQEPEVPVYAAEVVDEEPQGLHFEKDGMEFRWDGGRKSGLCFAIMILAIGLQMLLARIYQADISFWEISWPTVLLVFGLSHLFGRFSFIRLVSVIVGAWFLLVYWELTPFQLDRGLVFPILLTVFGVSLLVDALKKPNRRSLHIHSKNRERHNDFSIDGEDFQFNASFGEQTQQVQIACLHEGNVNCSFGDYTVDLSGVEAVREDCCLAANCSFGQLTLLIPQRFALQQSNSTAFAAFDIIGHADTQPQGTIALDANCSFGQIEVRYIP